MVQLSAADRDFKLNQVYTQLDRKFEEQETQKKSKINQLPYINLYGFPVDPSALAVIPKKIATELGVVPFFKEGRNLKVGVFEPSQAVFDLLKSMKDDYYAELYQISKSSLKHFLEGYKKVVEVRHKQEDIKITGSEMDASKIKNLEELGEQLRTVNITSLIDAVLTAAMDLNSSDVHWEPEENGMHVRFRIDGVLQNVTVLAKEEMHGIISRIKILSKMKLNVTNVPQDGSFSLHYNKMQVDIRSSILPSAFGESVVMRILRQDKATTRFEDLGIVGSAKERLEKEMQKPNGMILTTGPTGSGKTTALYSIINQLNEPGVKIITLEDPVEYKIGGITQTPINAETGLTFAAALRAVLRQDPDIVMVGEMRDLETAETAAQAALTGHIVLSTLHTNDAVSAIPRLVDLGLKPFIIAPAINAIIAQRLVRKICQFCKQEYKPDKESLARIQMILKSIPPRSKTELPKDLKFMHSLGCPKCSGLGYKGRIGIFEIFIIDEDIEKIIQQEGGVSEIKKAAADKGMITMAQDGILKALAGITDIEEVFRVTEE